MSDNFQYARIQLHDIPEDKSIFAQQVTSQTPRRYLDVGRSAIGPIVTCEINPESTEQTCWWYLVRPGVVVDRNVVGSCVGVLQESGIGIYSPCLIR